jgi:hypothetical protein
VTIKRPPGVEARGSRNVHNTLLARRAAGMARSAAKTALLSGYIGAGAGLLGSVGQGLSGLGGGAPSSMPKGYNPNSLSGLH